MRLAPLLVLLTSASGLAQVGPLRVQDAFGRPLETAGVTLVDWEGHIANPAIKLKVLLPPDTQFPADLNLHGTSSRVHFDRANAEDRYGIGKRVRLPQQTDSVEFYISMFPDRDGLNEEHQLVLQLFGPKGEQTRLRIPIHVIDQDKPKNGPLYPVILDYSEDQTGFTKSRTVRSILRQSADDWAYFLDEGGTDLVPKGDETIPIWGPDGFVQTRNITNRQPYRGYLMYICGIHHEELRAGGSPSLTGKPQTRRGQELPIRRSGTVEFEIQGNWNQLGWFLDHSDQAWWYTGSLRGEQADLYSIAVHEMGHALAFQSMYPAIARAKREGGLAGDALKAYLGKSPIIDGSDHFEGTVDPVSKYGAFGMEYRGDMKTRRWLITKAHLMCMEAVGYKLRKTAAFLPFTAAAPSKLTARVGQPLQTGASATGGVPTYFFRVTSGALPEGVHLNSFTGQFYGRATRAGDYPLTLQVDDSDPTTPTQTVATTLQLAS